jgi:hypothetical protein
MSDKIIGPTVKAHSPINPKNYQFNRANPLAVSTTRGHSTKGQPPKLSVADLLNGASKKHGDVNYNWSTRPRQHNAAGMGGMGHDTGALDGGGQQVRSSAEASPLHASPMDMPKGHDRPVALTWGHRDRASDHPATGRQSFSAKSLSPDERHALGKHILKQSIVSGSTHLPDDVNEN